MASPYVGLNVGGKIYHTSLTTLTRDPDSFFALMLSERVPATKDEHGNFLIDRDGEIFRHILNFLRYGKLILPQTFNEYPLLCFEADFFQLESLKNEINNRLPRDIAFNVDGSIHEIDRQDLCEEGADFAISLLNGEIPLQQDTNGDYLVRGKKKQFDLILKYLQSGNVCEPSCSASDSDDMNSIKDQAQRLQLKALCEHISDLEHFRKLTSGHFDRNRYANLYCFERDIYALYTLDRKDMSSFTPHSHLHNKHRTRYALIGWGIYGTYFIPSDRERRPIHQDEVVDYFARKLGLRLQKERRQLSNGCIVVEYRT